MSEEMLQLVEGLQMSKLLQLVEGLQMSRLLQLVEGLQMSRLFEEGLQSAVFIWVTRDFRHITILLFYCIFFWRQS